ncbi:TerC/Alx family metal homeostasis membrane protein [Actinomyces timonensis]|uniref:TerC/Alx family metal homeostasis membrane protein n=1 Tax=Actinomyces timonensis TaxID=1288391 RepID=UPI0002F6E059|nr:TerC/Alx family metal homeostasis membrane protein [Actinomyces timonensis]
MEVHALAWAGLIVVVIGLITVDFVGHARNPHPPSIREAATWTVGYMALAALFGLGLLVFGGGEAALSFYSGWALEWSLSLDNLFVFIIILTTFRVPRDFQQKALLLGIVIALVMRFLFILAGIAIINRFSAVFYLFGAFLIYTAIKQVIEARGDEDDAAEEAEEFVDNRMTRLVRRLMPTTDGFVGNKLIHRHAGRTFITPLLIVVVALGSADVMFALDSIPAIFGITQDPFLVFSATAFSLLGLRQLFFLIDGLLDRMAYLSYGLAVILGFIGFKLINHALHENELGFINGGRPVEAIPEPSTVVSLAVIVVSLLTVALVSVVQARRQSRVESRPAE